MSDYEITRRLEFDAGHRLLGHESRCRNNHGHRYRLDVTVKSAALDQVGRVIDFSVLKARVGGWIDEHLDHAYLGQTGDVILTASRLADLRVHEVPFAPTAENLARYLYDRAVALLLGQPIRVVRVRLYETPNCWADWPGTGGIEIDVRGTVT